jgi:D-lyxose ketol-isomerase
VYLYTEGDVTARPKARLPKNHRDAFTVWHEITLKPGMQYTMPANTLHWFQSGDEGAVISEFSSSSDDASDIFTHPGIRRVEGVSQARPELDPSQVRMPNRLR